MTVSNVFDKIFQNHSPHPIYFRNTHANLDDDQLKSLRDASSIFGLPELAAKYFSIPLIDLDPFQLAADVKQSLRNLPGPEKFLLAILRGMGTGKTRALEVLKYFLLLDDPSADTLAISITYNALWGPCDEDHACIRAASRTYYSFITRMLSMFYGLRLRAVHELLNKNLLSESELITMKPSQAENLFQDCYRHLMDRVRAAGNDKVVNFVLLVDEATTWVLDLKKTECATADAFQPLRDTMLNYNDQLSDGTRINRAVVLSGLTFSPFGKTGSDRSIRPLNVAERLNNARVASYLISKINPEKTVGLSLEERNWQDRQMELLATTANTLPRLMEILGTSLEAVSNNLNNYGQGVDRFLMNPDCLKEVLSLTSAQIEARYNKIMFPPLSLMKSILFNLAVVIDPDGMENIRTSMITNSVKDFPDEGEENKPLTLVPEANFFFLVQTAIRQKSTGVYELFKVLYDEIFEVLGNNKRSEGDLLEILTESWIRVKLLATGFDSRPITFANFFGISADGSDFLRCSPSLKDVLNKQIKSIITVENQHSQLSERPSTEEWHLSMAKQAIKAGIANVEKSGKSEKFDVMATVLLDDGDRLPFIIFVDTKSARDGSNNVPSWKQFSDTLKRIKVIGDAKEKSPVLEALKRGRYLYVYLTTFDKPMAIEVAVEEGEGHGIRLYKSATAKFFGPAFPLFNAIRTSVEQGKFPQTTGSNARAEF